MPAYNEAPTIAAVLDDLVSRVDHIVIVDDGSTDGTASIVDQWAVGRTGVTVIHFPTNRGLSAALRAGWDEVRAMVARGEAAAEDVAFSIDADGQHEPAAIDGMIQHLVQHGDDCVIGRRDMGYHTAYKRCGNLVMTWIACLSGGMRFQDVESGYRVFRIGPLLEAQQFYKGYRYSETVEVAVILARLGYRVSNDYPVHIPVARTRTRLKDAAIDAVCMPLAWYRLACWRDVPAAARPRVAPMAALAVFAIAILVALAMLSRPYFVATDSAHSYAHVWYLSHAIYDHGEVPLRMHQLESGDAMMFPYAFIPWMPTALVYPLLGDWGVTFSMVAGAVLLVWAAAWFRPRLRNPMLLALFLLNPFFWSGLLTFQLATFWSFGLLLLAFGLRDRRRLVWSGVALTGSFVAHPMMGPAGFALGCALLTLEARRPPRDLLIPGFAALSASLPAFVMFVMSPLLGDAPRSEVLLSAVDNMRRLTMIAAAFALPLMAPWALRYWAPVGAMLIAGLIVLLVAWPPFGLYERPEPQFGGYLATHPIDHQATYRVLTTSHREDGMIEFLKRGAVLSHEFFTESVQRRSFSSVEAYSCFLGVRGVGHVALSAGFRRQFATNEEDLLRQMSARGEAVVEYSDGALVYRVTPVIPPGASRTADCGM